MLRDTLWDPQTGSQQQEMFAFITEDVYPLDLGLLYSIPSCFSRACFLLFLPALHMYLAQSLFLPITCCGLSHRLFFFSFCLSLQHKLQGLDEWETIRDSQIKPSVMRALDVSGGKTVSLLPRF